MSNDTYRLHTGYRIPKLGFGTWEINPDGAAKEAVSAALQAGYTLIDTAKIYGNEEGVGEAIAESGIPREKLFITTKLWNDDQGYESTLEACKASLERLGLEYLDLYLIHWPATSKRHESWRAMERLIADGLIRSAGVSNYTVEHLQDLLQRSEVVPAVNQIEYHPFIYEQQASVLAYCQEQDIIVEAYSPVSRLGNKTPPVIASIAKHLGTTPQEVVLQWCIQRGTVPLSRSTNPKHIADNLGCLQLELSPEDIAALNSLSDGERVTWDPAGMG